MMLASAVTFFLLWSSGPLFPAIASTSTKQLPKGSTSTNNDDKPMRIAFCLTGQLARLELLSKIRNIFVPNAKKGHTVHMFMLLDNEDTVKQTYWRYDYSGTPYANFNTKKMEDFVAKKVAPYELGDKFLPRIRLEPRSQDVFEVVDGFVPVERKEINCKHTVCGRGENDQGAEEADARFQNNLSWMTGLRDCVKWMQVRLLPVARCTASLLSFTLVHLTRTGLGACTRAVLRPGGAFARRHAGIRRMDLQVWGDEERADERRHWLVPRHQRP